MNNTASSTSALGAPPPYDSFESTSGDHQFKPQAPGQIYEENEFGEMRPTAAGQAGTDTDNTLPEHQRVRVPIDTVFVENEHGEIHREATDPDLLGGRQGAGTNHFGEDTPNRAEAFHSDEVYPENRFGELGRADTFQEGHPLHLTEKLKETAEQIIGKFTTKKDHHDSRKTPPESTE